MDGFFSSVLSMFTPEVTSRSRRLKEIEKELEDEKERQDKLNGYYHSKGYQQRHYNHIYCNY